MKYRHWIITQPEIKPIPVKRYRKGLRIKRVQVSLREMEITYWLLLKDVVFDVKHASYIVSVFLDLHPWRVENMKAGKVLALYNHVKFQVERCNEIYDNISGILLQIDDGVDRSHMDGKENILTIYDLAGGDILKAEAIEKMSFIQVVNWLHAKNLHIRTEQNRYVKDKQNLKK